MNLAVPAGFLFAGVHCGIKRDPTRRDLGLIVSPHACTAAGVYTQNRVYAAPVAWDRVRTPASRIRAVVINSGNANACTGEQGLRDVAEMAAGGGGLRGLRGRSPRAFHGDYRRVFADGKNLAGNSCCRCDWRRTSPRFWQSLRRCSPQIAAPKVASVELDCGGKTVRIAGMAKARG